MRLQIMANGGDQEPAASNSRDRTSCVENVEQASPMKAQG